LKNDGILKSRPNLRHPGHVETGCSRGENGGTRHVLVRQELGIAYTVSG
jgi:hypothetical protein